MIYRLLISFIIFPILLLGQEGPIIESSNVASGDIGDCSGALRIGTNEFVKAQLTGNGGKINDFIAYESLSSYEELNSLWFRCETSIPGLLSITLDEVHFPFSYVAFLLNEDQSCELIYEGSLPPLQHNLVNEKKTLLFLLDSIQITEKQDLLFCINSSIVTKSEFFIITSFDTQYTADDIEGMKKIHNFCSDQSEQSFSIKIRDAESDLPVVAKVIVSETKKNNALYSASDFVFPYADNLRMHLKIDANGYFFKDEEISLRQAKSDELIIYLEPIEKNLLIELEGLGFVSQTYVLLPEAYPKIRRLEDFMAINPEVKIEIQGHVHLIGRNTFRARLLSKKRAKKVRQYLVDSGIDKSRIDVVGFGNSKMKYPEAETDAQVQANRRVEIKIK